jgi:hypothetical protein
MKIIVQKPSKIEPELIETFIKMVCEHSKICLDGLPERIERAALLSFAIKENRVAAIRAIKQQGPDYVRAVFKMAGMKPLYPAFKYETGWSVTLPEFRCKGLSGMLLKELLSHIKGNVYSTTRASNVAPQKILTRTGFTRTGNEFKGRIEPLVLWTYNYQIAKWREVSWL